MKEENAKEITYDVILFDGKPALFSDVRIEKESVPDGWFRYDIRHDDSGEPVTLEANVRVNHFGSLLVDHEITIPNAGYLEITDDMMDWLDGSQTTLRDYDKQAFESRDMSESQMPHERASYVVLTDDQHIKAVNFQPQTNVFDSARRIIGCQTIQIVEPDFLQKKGCVMLIDDDAKLREGALYVNCVASYLYRTHQHGDAIVGNAVIVKKTEEDVVPLTGEEAEKLSKPANKKSSPKGKKICSRKE